MDQKRKLLFMRKIFLFAIFTMKMLMDTVSINILHNSVSDA